MLQPAACKAAASVTHTHARSQQARGAGPLPAQADSRPTATLPAHAPPDSIGTIREGPHQIMRILQSANSTASCCVAAVVLQDVVAGDGTTSVVVICGALLKKAQEMLERGIHPTVISDSFNKAANKACEVRALPATFRRCVSDICISRQACWCIDKLYTAC